MNNILLKLYDKQNKTLVSASSIEKEIKSKKVKTDRSSLTGEILAKRAKENISEVYFDRGSYKYHGRVKTFAEILRKNGLKFNMVENKKIESDIKEKLVAINRITKVVKGGRRFWFGICSSR